MDNVCVRAYRWLEGDTAVCKFLAYTRIKTDAVYCIVDSTRSHLHFLQKGEASMQDIPAVTGISRGLLKNPAVYKHPV